MIIFPTLPKDYGRKLELEQSTQQFLAKTAVSTHLAISIFRITSMKGQSLWEMSKPLAIIFMDKTPLMIVPTMMAMRRRRNRRGTGFRNVSWR